MEPDSTVKHRLETAAGPEPREPDLAAIARRVARRRRRNRLAVVAVAAPLLVVVAVLAGTTPRLVIEPGPEGGTPTTVALPGAGDARAEWLDGVPVLVVNAGGGVHAVEAISPHRDLGMGDAVAWCRPAGLFVSVHAGDMFAPDGGYLGGPAPAGLVTFDTRVEGDTVEIGRQRAPAPRPRPPATAAPGPDPDATMPCFGPDADPASVVQHDWPPDPAMVSSPQEASAAQDAERLVVSGRLLVEDGVRPRLCALEGGPEECRGDWLPVTGLDQLHDDITVLSYEGLWRVDVVGGSATSVTQVRTELVAVDRRGGSMPPPPSPPFGPDDEVVVRDGVLQVPAVDLAYGRPPPEPLRPGAFDVWLDNHGHLPHSLVGETIDLDLVAEPGRRERATVTLPAGEHLLYCRIPGHREAGMEFVIVVEP